MHITSFINSKEIYSSPLSPKKHKIKRPNIIRLLINRKSHSPNDLTLDPYRILSPPKLFNLNTSFDAVDRQINFVNSPDDHILYTPMAKNYTRISTNFSKLLANESPFVKLNVSPKIRRLGPGLGIFRFTPQVRDILRQCFIRNNPISPFEKRKKASTKIGDYRKSTILPEISIKQSVKLPKIAKKKTSINLTTTEKTIDNSSLINMRESPVPKIQRKIVIKLKIPIQDSFNIDE